MACYTCSFFIQSGSWIVLAWLVSDTGSTNASAGYQVAIRNVVFFILPAWGLSNAAATLVGQNLGAKQPDRAEKSVLLTTKYNALFMPGVMLLFLLLPHPSSAFLRITRKCMPMGFCHCRSLAAAIFLRNRNGDDTGTKWSRRYRTPTWINFFGFWLFQIPFAFLLAKVFKLGPLGAFIAIPVAETVMALVAYYYFRKGKWKQVAV